MMLDQLVLLAAVTILGLLEQGNYHMIVNGQSNQYVSFSFHMLRETLHCMIKRAGVLH